MCGNENGVGDNGVTRFGNTPESNYGFHWHPSKDVEYDVVRERQLFWFWFFLSSLCFCAEATKGKRKARHSSGWAPMRVHGLTRLKVFKQWDSVAIGLIFSLIT